MCIHLRIDPDRSIDFSIYFVSMTHKAVVVDDDLWGTNGRICESRRFFVPSFQPPAAEAIATRWPLWEVANRRSVQRRGE